MTNTLTINGQPVVMHRKCAVRGCGGSSCGQYKLVVSDATTMVVYDFCAAHADLFTRQGYAEGVQPTWEFGPGHWLHDGSKAPNGGLS